MSQCSAWSGIIQKIKTRLSKWKSKTLSIGGRLTLLQSVLGTTPLYSMSLFKASKGVLLEMVSIRNKFFIGSDQVDKKITWIAWDKVLSSKKKRGLGVFSLFALNRGLILKWAWRFLSPDGSVWARVINAIYGSNISSHDDKLSSNWCSILREIQVLKVKGFDFFAHCKKKVENERCSWFWLDTWLLDKPFYVRFPRIFALETYKPVSVAAKWEALSFEFSFRRHVRDGVETEQWIDLLSLINTVSLSSSNDIWICVLNGEGVYRVKDIRYSLDDLFLPTSDIVTRWIKVIPIKINVFVWRASLDRLPTRLNLSKRGVPLDLQVVGYKLERYLILRRLCNMHAGLVTSLHGCWVKDGKFLVFFAKSSISLRVYLLTYQALTLQHLLFSPATIPRNPGRLVAGMTFSGDMSPGKSRTEKLEWDTFPGDFLGQQHRAHIF
nr:RNA-directed DNA polymerase, eukaryota, reverse transcriptase zinc-binding domain protein [Tanacetum cinerariifolium]